MTNEHNRGLFLRDAVGEFHEATCQQIIDFAKEVLRVQAKLDGVIMNSPQVVKDYLTLEIGNLDYEVFGVMFLDAQHRLIEYRQMFRGSITQTSVYPREVVKEALMLGACSLILSHNHPSGNLEPSRADELLTQTLKSSLQLIDVRVLDHVIVGGGSSRSFAELGLI